jgi:hypothetical protein
VAGFCSFGDEPSDGVEQDGKLNKLTDYLQIEIEITAFETLTHISRQTCMTFSFFCS